MSVRILLLAFVLFALCAALLAGLSARIAARAAADHPPRGSFVEVAGGRLHYRERRPVGEAHGTVVLVHGASAAHADLFATLGPELARYRVIAVDRPGHGWSERIAGDAMADPGQQAAAVMQALDTVAPEPFVLLAHSLGGALSTRIALDRPERLRGLVLLGAVTHPWPGGIAWYHHLAAAPLVGQAFTWIAGVPLARMLLDEGVASVFSPQPGPAGYREIAELDLLLRPASFRANSADIAATHAFVAAQAPRYRALTVPVIAISGDGDTIVSPVIHSAAIAREAPQGRLVLLPGVGHMPHHAAPEIVAGAVDALAGPRSALALNEAGARVSRIGPNIVFGPIF